MAEEATVAPGRVLGGRYQLDRLIAAGGMATVWLADDEKLERPVAVKVLSETLTADPAYRARFEREARVAAGMLHPNLVKVYDYAADGPRPYLVMEYVNGPTLAALISEDPALLEPRRLAAELLGALDHIHGAGVVHRDVKPSNVLIDADGSSKLTDFGIARPSDATQLTQTGHVIGTLSYMAPEVKEGGEADQRADLYSLGAVLGEVVRVAPDTEVAALADELAAERPEQRPPSAAAALAALPTADTAMAADPPTATTVAQTVPAPAPSAAAPASAATRDRARRRALAVAAGLAVAALLLLAVLTSGGDSGKAVRPARAADRQGGTQKQATPAPRPDRTTSAPAPAPPPAPAPVTSQAKAPKPEKTPKPEPPKPGKAGKGGGHGQGPHGEGPPGQLKKEGGDGGD